MDDFTARSFQFQPDRRICIGVRHSILIIISIVVHLGKHVAAQTAMVSSHRSRYSAFTGKSGKSDRLIITCQRCVCNLYGCRKITGGSIIQQHILRVCIHPQFTRQCMKCYLIRPFKFNRIFHRAAILPFICQLIFRSPGSGTCPSQCCCRK